MSSWFRLGMVSIILSLTLLAGCAIFPSNVDNSSDGPQPPQNNAQKALLLKMKDLAQVGKVINCEFPAKTSCIEDVEQKWGQADKMEWLPAAKGMYATFVKQHMVFGYNKGSQIFEVRTFVSSLKAIPLSLAIATLGKPQLDVKVSGQEIIGYIAGADFKMLLVFVAPVNAGQNYVLDHYSVLYPQGTVDSMAGDPGRQW